MNSSIAIITKKISTSILIDDILYLESDARKIVIVTLHGSYEMYGQIKNLSNLYDERFCIPMKNKPINIRNIKILTKYEVVFINDRVLYLSEKPYRILKKEFDNYLKETVDLFYV